MSDGPRVAVTVVSIATDRVTLQTGNQHYILEEGDTLLLPDIIVEPDTSELRPEDLHLNVFTVDEGCWVQVIYLPNGMQGVSAIMKSQLKAKEQALANLRANLAR